MRLFSLNRRRFLGQGVMEMWAVSVVEMMMALLAYRKE